MRLSEVALFTADVDRVARFYEQLLGEPVEYDPGEKAIFRSGSVTVLIHLKAEPMPGYPPDEDHVAYTVENADASCGSLTAQGHTLVHAPTTYPWGRSAYLRDPDGRLVELHEKQ